MSKEDKPSASDAEGAGQGGERIAKRLARAGVASRRDAEAMIAEGRVKVNGRVLSSPAFNVTDKDRIEVDDEPLPPIERTRLFLFHKPAGVVTTSRDPEGRQTIFDILPEGTPRLITVGRLDISTEGLILLTNDGGLARQLELPATGWLRRYRVRVHGKVDEQALANLKDGIAVDGVYYGAVEASLDRVQGSNAWLTIGIREGKNREVRNILGALGLEVNRLIRISYGPFQLGELAERELREIKGRTLRDQLGAKLIEAAGANFDAPVERPFSNKPVKAEQVESPSRETRPGDRKRRKEDGRMEALDRLSTKREGAPKPKRDGSGAKPGRPGAPAAGAKRADGPPRSRAANVWMAPGARPKGPAAKARDEERAKRRREGDEPRRPPRSREDAALSPGSRTKEGSASGRSSGDGKPWQGKRPGGSRPGQEPHQSPRAKTDRPKKPGGGGSGGPRGRKGPDRPSGSGPRRGPGNADRRR